MIKVLTRWFLLRPLSLACGWLPSHRVPTWPLLCVLKPLGVSSSAFKDTSPLGLGSHLMISFNLNSFFNAVSLGLRLQRVNLGGEHNSVPNVGLLIMPMARSEVINRLWKCVWVYAFVDFSGEKVHAFHGNFKKKMQIGRTHSFILISPIIFLDGMIDADPSQRFYASINPLAHPL